MKRSLSCITKRFLTIPVIGLGSCLIVSCGSGPEYQEPAYEIKELPASPAEVDVARPDFDVPGMQVQNPNTPLVKPKDEVVKGRPLVTAIPLARPVPGRPGCVFNPFNQNIVDVEGIPSGTKVVDPLDKDKTHVFKVP